MNNLQQCGANEDKREGNSGTRVNSGTEVENGL